MNCTNTLLPTYQKKYTFIYITLTFKKLKHKTLSKRMSKIVRVAPPLIHIWVGTYCVWWLGTHVQGIGNIYRYKNKTVFLYSLPGIKTTLFSLFDYLVLQWMNQIFLLNILLNYFINFLEYIRNLLPAKPPTRDCVYLQMIVIGIKRKRECKLKYKFIIISPAPHGLTCYFFNKGW